MNFLMKLYNALIGKSDCCGKPLMYWGAQGYCDPDKDGCGKRDF